MASAFADAASNILATRGSAATYHSLTDGPVALTIHVARAVEVMDESGAWTRGDIATLATSVKPRSGDWFEIGSERWAVDAIKERFEHLQHVFVRPKL